MGCSLILCEIVKKMTYMLKNSQNKWSKNVHNDGITGIFL